MEKTKCKRPWWPKMLTLKCNGRPKELRHEFKSDDHKDKDGMLKEYFEKVRRWVRRWTWLDIYSILYHGAHISPISHSCHSYLLLGSKQTMPDSTLLPPVAQLCRWSHGLLSSALPAVLCSVLRCTVLYCAVLCWPGLGLTHIRTSVCCSGVWCGRNFQLFELWQEVTPGCSGPSDSEGVLHSWKLSLRFVSVLSLSVCEAGVFREDKILRFSFSLV